MNNKLMMSVFVFMCGFIGIKADFDEEFRDQESFCKSENTAPISFFAEYKTRVLSMWGYSIEVETGIKKEAQPTNEAPLFFEPMIGISEVNAPKENDSLNVQDCDMVQFDTSTKTDIAGNNFSSKDSIQLPLNGSTADLQPLPLLVPPVVIVEPQVKSYYELAWDNKERIAVTVAVVGLLGYLACNKGKSNSRAR